MTDWRDRAVCRKVGVPDDWFPKSARDSSERTLEAVEACLNCPVRTTCRDTALGFESGESREYRFGIWGGLTPGQRAALDRPRRAGRPAVDYCAGNSRRARVMRHVARSEPLCEPCREYEQRRQRDEQVLRLAAAGMTPHEIGLTVGERRDTVRGILARHLAPEQESA